jgi:tetratricopeptide (TPR) repeat protein
LLAAGWFFVGLPALAQPPFEDTATPLPANRSATWRGRAHQEALRFYARGLIDELGNHIPEAIRAFEKAAELEPGMAVTQRALAEIYLATQQTEKALTACQKALEIDPGDGATWYVYAGELKDRGRLKEAAEALEKGLACPSLKRRRDLRAEMYYELACLYDEAQDAARAEPAYREVIKTLKRVVDGIPPGTERERREALEGKLVDTYDRIIRVCAQAHRDDRAIAAFEEAKAAGLVRSGRLSYQVAQVYLAKGDAAKALELVCEYLRTQPAGTEGYELRSAALTKLNRQNEILLGLEEYARRDAHNVALHLLLASQYELAGKRPQAEDLYRHIADDSPAPDVYRAWFVLYRHGRAAEVLKLLESAMSKASGAHADPGAALKARAMLIAIRDDAELAKALVPAGLQCPEPLCEETLRFLAALAARCHQLDAADQFYRGCLDHRLSRDNEGIVYGGLLEVLWEARRFAEIVEICRKALDEMQDPSSLPLHRSLAVALSHLGRVDEALAEADEAAKAAGPEDRLISRLTRVEVLRRAGRYAEAASFCETLLKDASRPKEARDVHVTLSNIYSAAHQSAKAERELREVLKLDPDDATANNDLGYLLADEGRDLAEAEAMIRKAIALDQESQKRSLPPSGETIQENAAFLDSLGWVLFRRGRNDAARTELETAVKLPDAAGDPVVWDHLAEVLAKLGRTQEAQRAWEKAISLYDKDGSQKPDDQYRRIQEKLRRLRAANH